MVPNVVHYVFGLAEQEEPFHLLHYLSIVSCAEVLAPERIYFHHKHLPWGPYWDRVAPDLALVETDLVPEVLAADYSAGRVPVGYRYAHHADFIRLDALIEHGGIYADIDTLFVRRPADELLAAPFVIGREPPVRDEWSGALRPSLCNALLLSEPGSTFARTWRQQMAAALDGTWSNHSGFLAQSLSEQCPDQVRVEAEETFFPFPGSPAGLAAIFEQDKPIPASTVSIHLWAHLWWRRERRDFSRVHAGWLSEETIRRAPTTFGRAARPFLPQRASTTSRAGAPSSGIDRQSWSYLSLDETSGYGVAADRCRSALSRSGLEIDWTPFVDGGGWSLAYQPPEWLEPLEATAGRVVVAHLVPEYFPLVRRRVPEAFLVGHTVWETDRVPAHWTRCLEPADLLVVPSWFSAEAIVTSGVASPVAVVPHVALPPRSSPPTSALASAETFVFYTIAEWNERKAPFKTIEAYLRAFTAKDPVLLVVKTSPVDVRGGYRTLSGPLAPGSTARALAGLMAGRQDPPAVRLLTRRLSEAGIAALHAEGDCFVSLCRSEGWGLGSFDAAAASNPVVTTGYGGHLDYLAGSPWLVDFSLVPAEDPAGFPSYAPDQRWAEPDIDHAVELLREIVASRALARSAAEERGREICWRYRPEAVASAFRSAVDQYSVESANSARPRTAAGPQCL